MSIARLVTSTIILFVTCSSVNATEVLCAPFEYVNDYQDVLRFGHEKVYSRHLNKREEDDFIFSYPKTNLKKQLIRSILDAVPEGLFIQGITYNKDKNILIIKGVFHGSARISAFMRGIEKSFFMKSPNFMDARQVEVRSCDGKDKLLDHLAGFTLSTEIRIRSTQNPASPRLNRPKHQTSSQP